MADITVVKCGGTAGVDVAAICRDVAWLRSEGQSVVLVHGGSADIERLAEQLGVARRRLQTRDRTSVRYTDERMLEIVQMALSGVVKPRLVSQLAALSIPAIGLTGIDAGLIRARRSAVLRAVVDGRAMVVRDNYGGRITGVDTGPLQPLLAGGVVPVVSPPALGDDAHAVNVDADRAAAAVAAALGARTLVLLTGAPGVLADPQDSTSTVPVLPVTEQASLASVSDGMAVKLDAGREALMAAVPHVVIADGRRDRPVQAALDGAGTTLVLDTHPVAASR